MPIEFFPSLDDTKLISQHQIFVLSIAINYYKSKKITPLQGCLNDSFRLKQVLQQKYQIPNENYLILENEKATRDGIINAFRQHFSKLKNGNIAVFHFSGHGYWEKSSPEFVAAGIENVGGKNEVLVVQDYGDEGVYNIADKELRYLISELQVDKKIHFIGLVDCCHSGSIFRNEELRVRRTQLNMVDARPLDQYLEGQYAKMLQKARKLVIPAADFVLFSACSPLESAIEDSEGGIFTQHLCHVLEHLNELPSYADLHYMLRNSIQLKTRHLQNPYFEFVGTANPFQRFLNSEIDEQLSLPKILKKGVQYVVNLGAIHGVNKTNWSSSRISVYKKGDFVNAIGIATIDSVEIEQTSLRLNFDTNEVFAEHEELFVGLYGSPLGIEFHTETDAKPLEVVLLKKIEAIGLKHSLVPVAQAAYKLIISKRNIRIYNGKRLIINVELEQLDTALDFICQMLQKITKWEHVNQICPPKDTIIESEKCKFDISFTAITKDNQKKQLALSSLISEPNQITLPLGTDIKYFLYHINIQNLDSYPNFIYLIHLDHNYGISQKIEAFTKPLRFEEHCSYDSGKNYKALGLAADEVETSDIYLLFIARNPLSYPQYFYQEDIENYLGKVITFDELRELSRREIAIDTITTLANWTVKRIGVKVVRSDKELNELVEIR